MQIQTNHNFHNITIPINLVERNKSIQQPISKVQYRFSPIKNPSPIKTPKHQRNLSPWNRKKEEIIEIKTTINNQPAHEILNIIQKQIDINTPKNTTSHLKSSKMTDFLQRIHFTNKKSTTQQQQQTASPNKTNHFQQSFQVAQKHSTNKSKDLNVLSQEEIKTIIVYPKNHTNSKKKMNPKDKNKSNSTKKIATIQNFYDPFQNKTKMSKKMIKYRLKLNDQISQQQIKTKNVNEQNFSIRDFQITWRKNTIPQKLHKRNFSMPQNQIHESKKCKNQSQKQFRQTNFLKTRTTFSRNFRTQPTQRENQQKHNPQKCRTQYSPEEQKCSTFEPTYATSSGQAIKRIKHQYKKSRKIKAAQNNSRHQHTKSVTQASTRQNNLYLYQTFLNYKSSKDSSGMNITKTLGFNFHNHQTFNKNIAKVWLKTNN